MSKTELSKEEYLRKYLDGVKSKKSKKKKKVNKFSNNRMKIIEEDLDLKSLELQVDDDNFLDPDCQPSIVEIIDERSFIQGGGSKWKQLNETNEFNNRQKRQTQIRPSNDSRQNPDSDTSPPRRQRHDSNTSPPRRQRHDSDTSPPRRQRYDSDNSPPRRQGNDSDNSLPRRQRHDSDNSPPRRQRHDSDNSPPRRQRHDSDNSPPRRQRHDSDNSPPRRQRHDSDNSPPRRQRHDSDTSPPRRQRHDSDVSNGRVEDQSKSSKHRNDRDGQSSMFNKNNSHCRQRSDNENGKQPRDINRISSINRHSNSKESFHNKALEKSKSYRPQSKNLSSSHNSVKVEPLSDCENAHIKHSDRVEDISIKEEYHTSDDRKRKSENHKHNSHYLKHKPHESSVSDPKYRRHNEKHAKNHVSQDIPSSSDSENDHRKSSNLPKKTLSGAKAGLSSASELKAEMDKMRRDEKKHFKDLDPQLLGKNAQTVVRGSKRPKELTAEEKKELLAKEEEKKELHAQYNKWGRGLKQIAEQERRVDNDAYEMSKPLARYHGDKDLEKRLKDEVYEEEDPMAAYILKKRKKHESSSDNDSIKGTGGTEKKKVREFPKFKGDFPPNRFGLRPGYRWDGVDRTNGFEKRYFEMVNKRKSNKNAAYKWSVEDM